MAIGWLALDQLRPAAQDTQKIYSLVTIILSLRLIRFGTEGVENQVRLLEIYQK